MAERIRVNLQFERDTDPGLFDDLVRFTDGKQRASRLRTLAHDGLIVTMVLQTGGGRAGSAPAPGGASLPDAVMGQAAAELFESR